MKYTIEEIRHMQEGQTFDCKSILIAPKHLATIMVAMANADGGMIAVGISDKTRRVEGVDQDKEHLNDILRTPLDFCVPSVSVTTEYKLRTEVENLSDSIRECKPIISEEMQKMAIVFGARLLCDFLSQIESKCKEAERRMKKAGNTIPIPYTAFYILIIIVVALSSFFVCMIVANAEILHSGLIWKATTGCILMAVLGIGIAVVIQKFLDRGK